MARELGLNPGKLGKISNHRQEPWKAPLPQFIEHLYLKRFGRDGPGRHCGGGMGAAGGARKTTRNAAPRTPAVTQGRGAMIELDELKSPKGCGRWLMRSSP